MEERGTRETGPRRGIPRPFHLIFLMLAAATFLSAQSLPKVRCDALVGFNGVVRGGRYAPVIVSVESPAARLSVKVGVEVRWGSGLLTARGGQLYTRDVLLSGGATKRVSFVVPVPRDGRGLVVTVSSPAGVLAHQDVDLRSMMISDRLVAAVSSELSLDALTGLGGEAEPVRLAYPRLDDLPDSWAGYDGVDMVVVHDTYFQQLRSSQVDALERWVATGGTLVFTGGAAAFQHAASGLARLLPVEVEGVTARDGLPSIAALCGARQGPRGRTVLAESRAVAGKVVAEEGGVPLIVRRALGVGAVWFTAFDPTLPPLSSWEGTLGLWRLMAGRERSTVLLSASRDPLDDPWMKALLGTPPLSFPSPLIALLFVAVYLLLLFMTCVGHLSRVMKPRLRMTLLILVPAAACVYAGLAFNEVLFRPGPQVLEASRARTASGEGIALVTTRIGLVTAKGGSVSLSFGSRDVTVDEVGPWMSTKQGRAAVDRNATVEVGETTVIRDAALGRFGSRLFVVNDAIPFHVDVERRRQGSTIVLTVSNGETRALRGCFFWEGNRAYPVGDVAPGARVSRSYGVQEGLATLNPATRGRLMADPRKADLWSLEAAPGNGETGMLACWVDEPLLPVSFTGAERARGRAALTLVVVEAQ